MKSVPWSCKLVYLFVGLVAVVNAQCITTDLLFSIFARPISSIVEVSNNVTLICSAIYLISPIFTPRYSWHRVNGNIPSHASGQNTSTLTISGIVPGDAGQYYCMASLFGHCARSDNAIVIIERNCTIKGQILKACGTDPRCATTCTNRFNFRGCFGVCTSTGVCVCPSGMIIDEDSNECVPPRECPEIPCPGKGQIFAGGCNPVNATCSNPNPPILCDIAFCACPFGQVLDESTNTCVNVLQCVLCSIKGQIPTADCFGINATCSNPNPPKICDFPQCVCPRGQVIDEATNSCINGTECRKGCSIRRISGKVKYKNNKRRLTLRFSPNRQGQEAFFQCQIDDQRFRTCTSPMVWRNLNLSRRKHTVTVRGSCTYNGGVTSTSLRKLSFRVHNQS